MWPVVTYSQGFCDIIYSPLILNANDNVEIYSGLNTCFEPCPKKAGRLLVIATRKETTRSKSLSCPATDYLRDPNRILCTVHTHAANYA